ncbi:lipid A ABC transporter permease/ATP-binding protein [Paenibacillus sp. MY03]|uniref:ABC transporter ATP-binding protein n=1 Tax=Paenibacillus sp. MY03 TaxID=302980 RepID=UPI000B3CE031|nr:ABC transporter ATP-binding protein [Paenibacillus sp. MY03]OUS74839.1 lipid A ABC transporter permease/ATP-binding protein [Paenibacillus sp. MY03]
MDIHNERRLTGVKDGLLWRKMMAFAVPYWRSLAVSLLFALLVAGAAVTQPLLVKSAIDDRINGLMKPMVYVADAASLARLAGDERTQGKPIVLGERTYYRVSQSGETWPEGIYPASISQLDGAYYLQEGRSGESGSAAGGEGYALSKEEIAAFRQQDYSGLIILAMLFVLNVAVTGIFTYWQSVILSNTGQKIIFDMRNVMFSHLSKLQTSYFDRNPVGRLVTRVAHDVEAVNQLYSQVIVNLAKEVLMLVGIASIMLVLNVKLALVSFAVIPLLVLVTFYFKGIIREAQRVSRLMLSRLNSFLAESLSGMTIVQMFTREKQQLDEFVKLNDEHYRAGMRGSVNNSIFNPMIGFVGNLALALVVWYGGHSVLAAGVTFGVVYAFTTYVRQFFQPLTALADRYTQIQTALASAERIFEMLEERPDIVDRENAKEIERPLKGAIRLERAWFAYNKEEWVLKDINISIKPGETVAFVGATGAGKSSIIGLINRFYDIQRGSLMIDGVEVKDYKLDQLRQSVGVIQQDPFVFTGNIYDNIRMNRADLSDEDIRNAARELEMDEFIERLPQGYETPVGERGVKLSSGQQQLLAFLRVYVSDPDILILDEATSHIDTETEETLQRGLLRLSKGKTTLIVAHRLSTIRHADNIIVLDKGRVQEMGDHDTLMRRDGHYRKLYELQNDEGPKEQRGAAARAGGALAATIAK